MVTETDKAALWWVDLCVLFKIPRDRTNRLWMRWRRIIVLMFQLQEDEQQALRSVVRFELEESTR